MWNPKKFSFAELTSNASGKTSGSGTIGILISFTGCILSIYFGFTKQIEGLTQAVFIITIGASLLGYKKSQEKFETPSDPNPSDPS